MKKIYLFLCLLVSGVCSVAQVSITATLGAPGPVNYTTLKEGFDAINAGAHLGIITITISGNTTETASAVLNASGAGLATYASVSIRPGEGMAGSVTGDIPGPLIDLNGADHVTIDGIGTDGAALTVSNINTAATAASIRLINDANMDTIRNVTILGGSSAVTSGTVLFSTGTVTGNDNNMIANCNISNAPGNFPVNGIYSAGTTGQENNNITISNNNISNFFNPALGTTGVLIAGGNTDWVISGNRFFQTASRTFTAGAIHRAIQVTSGNNYAISGNIIGYAASNGTGTYTLGGAVTSRFIAIDLAVGTTIASSVQNNSITHFSFVTSNNASSSSGIWCGIFVSAGDVNIGTITGNMIGSTSATGDITVMPTVAGTLVVPITSSSTGNINIANNIIGGIDLLPSAALSGNLPGISVSGASGNINITNNTIGNTLPNNMRIGTAGVTTGNGIIRGIFDTNGGTVSIVSNTIRNLVQNSNNALALFRGIECQAGTVTVSANSISNIAANGTSTGSFLTHEGIGIIITTGNAGAVVDGNSIFNLSVSNPTSSGLTLSGIYLGSAVNNISIIKNRIYGLSNASTSTSLTIPGVITGIYCRDAVGGSPMTIVNNMISLGNGQATNTAMIGIWHQVSSATGYIAKIYYNSVNIEGTATTGSQPSFCYYRGDFAASFTGPIIDIKNNIFNNSRSGGSGKHYAIANTYGAPSSSPAGWSPNAADYNVLNANDATIGYWSGDQTFNGWKAASSGDGNSLSLVPVNFLNSASDLHLTTNANAGINGKGIAIAGFITDFDNDFRSPVSPDPGADEFNNDPLPIIVEYFRGKKQGNTALLTWKAACNAASVVFNIERSADGRQFTGIRSIAATSARCSMPFDIGDNQMLPGLNYYRLKMTEPDGSIYYSYTIAVINKEAGFEIVAITPSLGAHGPILLHTSSSQNTRIDIAVTEMSGKTVLKQTAAIGPGSDIVTINSSKLGRGRYYLTVYTADGRAGSISFIKQ